ncbi:hypothetical protein [Agromyces salentinus]|uniref:ABC transporter n=1 Tax=Agromyces salentinus TaxID=269421 RepID=A0ABN2MYK9_9MICO|nr:hypothetical protein [Agromyces salentinus]
MSDRTSGPDQTGAVPADEGDTSQTSTTDAAADVPAETATPSTENDLANALTAEPAAEPVPADEPQAEAVAEPPAAEPVPNPEPVPVVDAPASDVPEPVVVDAPEPDSSVDAEQARTARLDEAVQRANAGAVASDEPAVTASEPTVPVEPVHDEHETPIDYDAYPEPVSADSVRRETYVPPAPEAVAAAGGAATLAPEPVPQQPQTIYVQAPVPPKTKGNRGFGALVAAIGAVAFALLYAGVSYLILIGRGDSDRAADVFVSFLGSAVFWVPIVAVFIGFALLAAIINRGPWWMYAVFGLLVGVLVYFSYIGASLLTVQAWTLTFDEAARFIGERWLDPFAIAAAVIAREIPIWFGGWIAARGRTVTERNRVARETYDRELAAGPKPVG